jgi:hypothetical protein
LSGNIKKAAELNKAVEAGKGASSGGGGGGGSIIQPLPNSTAAQTAMEHEFPEPKVHFEEASMHTSWLEAHKARHGISNDDKKPC